MPEDSPSDESRPVAELSYRDAMQEINGILRAVDSDEEVDIDQLADQVERASVLLRFCTDKLKKAEVRIEQVSKELADDPAGGAATPD